MTPFITIITPTVFRDSLIKCCDSIDEQTYTNWQHVIMNDSGLNNREMRIHIKRNDELGKRWIHDCDRPHRNGGNTCRHNAWDGAMGKWIFHCDDDNFLASPTVLEEIAAALEGIEEKWALFPIHRHGSIFYFDPPKPCYFDTGNAMVRREIAQWPNINDYCSDAVWLVDTLLKHPYKAFPNANPIMVMPGTSFGAGGGINGV